MGTNAKLHVQFTDRHWEGLGCNPLDRGLVLVLEGRPLHPVAGVEGEPEGNCHFAGEHTSVDFQGYLNGAVESGQRAAQELLST
jgi:monoamine oxidase